MSERDATCERGVPVVFLGPSLPRRDAAAALAATYLPPARCGDIVACLRLRPPVIVLVDGVFERSPAVWHKEVLWALEHGVAVLGAASMGALRAAELAPFGMIGVGAVYDAYRRGELVDDDEVAVAHAGPEDGFRCLSEALVDIRAVVDRARRDIGLDPVVAGQVVDAARSAFYPERSLAAAVDGAARAGADRAELDRLLAHAAAHPWSQKAADAAEALAVAARGVPRPPPGHRTNRSVFFRKHVLEVASRPLPFDPAVLPPHEQHLAGVAAGPLDGPLLRDLARLLAVAEAVGRGGAGAGSGSGSGSGPSAATHDFDAVATGDAGRRARLATVAALVEQVAAPAPGAWADRFVDVARAYGAYATLRPQHRGAPAAVLDAVADPRFATLRRVARLWHTLLTLGAGRGIEHPPGAQAELVAGFLDARGVGARQRERWQRDNRLDGAGLDELARREALVRFLWDNPQALGTVEVDLDVCWLGDAVALHEAPTPASTGAAWAPAAALEATYRFLDAEVLPTAGGLFGALGQPAPVRAGMDPVVDEVGELLLDANEHVFCAPSEHRRREHIRSWARGRVLDHGCGAGFHALDLALRGHHVTCVDTNEVKLRFVKWAAEGLGVADRVDFTWEGLYDTVLSVNVLDHLPDASGLVDELAASLHPGGILVLAAHFSADGFHTSDDAVVGRVYERLCRHFERLPQAGTEVELWRRARGDRGDRAGAGLLARHEELRWRRRPDGSAVVDGPRFYLRPTELSATAVKVLDACDGVSPAGLRDALAGGGGLPAAVVDEVLDGLRRHRLVTLSGHPAAP